MLFRSQSLVEHQETEACVGEQGAGPAVVRSVESLEDLVQVVACTHSPFHHIVLEQVVAIREIIGIPFSFALYIIKVINNIPAHAHALHG